MMTKENTYLAEIFISPRTGTTNGPIIKPRKTPLTIISQNGLEFRKNQFIAVSQGNSHK